MSKQVRSKANKLYNLSLELIVENKKVFIVDSFVKRPRHQDKEYDEWVARVKTVTGLMGTTVYGHVIGLNKSYAEELEKLVNHKSDSVGQFIASKDQIATEVKFGETKKKRKERKEKPPKATVSVLATVAIKLSGLGKLDFDRKI